MTLNSGYNEKTAWARDNLAGHQSLSQLRSTFGT